MLPDGLLPCHARACLALANPLRKLDRAMPVSLRMDLLKVLTEPKPGFIAMRGTFAS